MHDRSDFCDQRAVDAGHDDVGGDLVDLEDFRQRLFAQATPDAAQPIDRYLVHTPKILTPGRDGDGPRAAAPGAGRLRVVDTIAEFAILHERFEG